jgi:hypothetical protein
MVARSPEAAMASTTLLPFQPDAMTPAQLAAVSYLARYNGHTHTLYAYQLRRWFTWCETNAWTRWSGSSVPTLSSTSDTSATAG